MKKSMVKIAVALIITVMSISGISVAVAQDNATVQSVIPVLEVSVPSVVTVGEEVVLSVTERSNGMPVAGVSVYSLSYPLTALSAIDNCIWPHVFNYEFLGKTGGGGNLTCVLDTVGVRLIMATREGYGPGLVRLTVRPNLAGDWA